MQCSIWQRNCHVAHVLQRQLTSGDGMQCAVDVLWGRLDLLVVKQVDHVLQHYAPDPHAHVKVNLLKELWCVIHDILDARQHVVLPLVEVIEDLHAGLGPKSRERVP